MAGYRSSSSSINGFFKPGGDDGGLGGGRRRRRRRVQSRHCYNDEDHEQQEEEEEEGGEKEEEEEDRDGQVPCGVPFAWEEKPGTPKEERSHGRAPDGPGYHCASIASSDHRSLPPPPSSSPFISACSHARNSASSYDRRFYYSPQPRSSPGLAGIIRGAIFCGSNMQHRGGGGRGGAGCDNLDPFQVAMEHLIEEDEDPTMALPKKKKMNNKTTMTTMTTTVMEKKRTITTKAESGTHSRIRSLSSIAIPWHCQEEEEQQQQPVSLASHINGHLPQAGSKSGDDNDCADSYGNAYASNKAASKNCKDSHNSMKWTIRDLLYRSFGSARNASHKEASARKSLLQGRYIGQAAFPSNQCSVSTSDIASSPTSSPSSSSSSLPP